MVGEMGGPEVTPGAVGSYILKSLVQDIPLSGDGHPSQARITCVELCESNLYIGTSQAEILHFVAIPTESGEESSAPQFIFASRVQPAFNAQATNGSETPPGIQTILVLPEVQKACILCNSTLSFYSLPELSPVFTTVPNCSWVGGVDLDATAGEQETGVVVMICVRNRARLVKISEAAGLVRNIEFAGCLRSVRRRNFACVADAHAYALLDVENQQKFPLFPISSLDDNVGGGRVEDISSILDPNTAQGSISSRPKSREADLDPRGHGRSTSLGALVGGLGRRQGSPQPTHQDAPGVVTPGSIVRESSPSQSQGHGRNVSTPETPKQMPTTPEKPLPLPPPRSDSLRGQSPARLRKVAALMPHIVSPTSKEFLLTTGTGPQEPGVGIFVNLDGDVVRGTLQFDRYPQAIVVDGRGIEAQPDALVDDREGFVLAAMSKSSDKGDTGEQTFIQVQRWDMENGGTKEVLDMPTPASGDSTQTSVSNSYGLRNVNTAVNITLSEVGELLRNRRLKIEKKSTNGGPETLEDWEEKRNEEELTFSQRLGGRDSHILAWSGNSIWWMLRTPLIVKLNAAVDNVMKKVPSGESYTDMERSEMIRIVNSIRGVEPTSETEFLSLEFVRQKISLILFADLLARPTSLPKPQAADLRITEGLLIEGGIDPRVIICLIPLLNEEVVEGRQGIWLHAGLLPVVEWFVSSTLKTFQKLLAGDLPNLLKRYLGSWRQRKGMASIADEAEVFQTVDAALLRILLEQDGQEQPQTSKPSSTRLELYSLVDSGTDCFDRAIILLEQYKRLFVLSRLYQTRKMARKVLEIWKRIIEGEVDKGGGLAEGEHEVRKYLANIRDTALVDEYGTWLARRNPALGVQVFANDSSRVKWEPQQAVMLLRGKAPDAVKFYLEHLVFGKKNVQYANDLISYYLDSVLTVLKSSNEARSILAQSYESYRALHPPKPTYRQFIIENAVPLPWWHDRLRLLELIGGSHGSDFSYDVDKILSRIEPFEEDLVPESIILDGRQGRHKQALRLLTHGLGDYHTAVNYCLLGGASIFHPTSGSAAAIAAPSQEEQAVLFGFLLTEFLRIEDISDRLERTSELLERFGSWYDVREVLDLIPESWSVRIVSGFLVSSLRRLVHERNEATITKALSGAENLQIASAFVEKCSSLGPHVEGGT